MSVHSQFLNKLTKEERDALIKKLCEMQNGKCFICGEPIAPSIQSVNIDHICPLANKGKDDESNFAVTHESCNKSKNDADLRIARILFKLQKIRDNISEKGKVATLQDVLDQVDGSKYLFKYQKDNGKIKYSFSEAGDNTIYEVPVYKDNLSGEESCFIEVPLSYIYHDEKINPRGINNGIDKLIKEFYKTNPQLHLSLARIDEDGKIKIFDGQHKAVAQIMLGTTKLVLRLFLNPNIQRLTETNKNAGSVLKQVAFDKSIIRQLNNTLYQEKIDQYKAQKNLGEDDWSFSEQNLVDFFRGESSNIRKYVISNLKQLIVEDPENKLKDYINKGGRENELPISASSFDKTFLSLFINPKNILTTPMDFQEDEGTNPRFLERTQIVHLLNIIAEEIYINRYNPEVGSSRIEDRIIKGQDEEITEAHLIAYRMSREEIMNNWLTYLLFIIKQYFLTNGLYVEDSYFQYKFPEPLWANLKNAVINLRDLPLWINKSIASTIFSGKKPYGYWKTIFETGKEPGDNGVQVLAKPLNILELIVPKKD